MTVRRESGVGEVNERRPLPTLTPLVTEGEARRAAKP